MFARRPESLWSVWAALRRHGDVVFSASAALLLFLNSWSTSRQKRLIKALDRRSDEDLKGCVVPPERHELLEDFSGEVGDTFQFDRRIRSVGYQRDGQRSFYDLDCLASLQVPKEPGGASA